MPVTGSIAWPNILWSLLLFGIILWKIRRLRDEIHQLVEGLPTMGSQFIRSELNEVRDELDRTRARVQICEERLGLNGQQDEA